MWVSLLLVTTSFSSAQGLIIGVQENHAASPNVAMCITGQMRAGSKPEVRDSQVINMRQFAPNINVFVYINPEDEDPSPFTTMPDGRGHEPFDFFKEGWGENLIQLKTYTKKDVSVPANTCGDRTPMNGTRMYSQWMTWKGCYEMVKAEENTRQTKYDVVIKLRPDTLLKGRLPFSPHDVISTQPAVWGRENHHHYGLDDVFIVAHRATADAFFGTHLTYWKCWDETKMENTLKTYGDSCPWAGECLLMNHLKDSGVPVHHVWNLNQVVTVARDCHGKAVVEIGNGLQACAK
jgi:hypothetical protein